MTDTATPRRTRPHRHSDMHAIARKARPGEGQQAQVASPSRAAGG